MLSQQTRVFIIWPASGKSTDPGTGVEIGSCCQYRPFIRHCH